MTATKAQWKCNTPALLKELIDCNPTAGLLATPVAIFARMLAEVADRASELNDPKLNLLMSRLALYEACDPDNSNYDEKIVKQIEEEAKEFAS